MYCDTPLHFAADYGEKSGIIESLLEAGADLNAKNDNNKIPWDLLKRNDAPKDTKGYLALNDTQ